VINIDNSWHVESAGHSTQSIVAVTRIIQTVSLQYLMKLNMSISDITAVNPGRPSAFPLKLQGKQCQCVFLPHSVFAS